MAGTKAFALLLIYLLVPPTVSATSHPFEMDSLFHLTGAPVNQQGGPQERVPIGVLDLQGNGITTSDARAISDRLRFYINEFGVFQLLERNEMQAIVEEQGLQISGCVDTECAVQIGQILGVKKMVAGSISRVESFYTIQIRMFDVETSTIEAMAVSDAASIERMMNNAARNVAEDLYNSVIGVEGIPEAGQPHRRRRMTRAESLTVSPLRTGWMFRVVTGPNFMEARTVDDFGMNFKGMDISLAMSVGKTITPRLLFFVEYTMDRLVDPDIDHGAGNYIAADDSFALTQGFGSGFAYYFMPSNLHIAASLVFSMNSYGEVVEKESTTGGSSSTYTSLEPSDSSPGGVGIHLVVGKEWWIAHRLSLGIAGRTFITRKVTSFAVGASFTWDVFTRPRNNPPN